MPNPLILSALVKVGTDLWFSLLGKSHKKNSESKVSKVLFYETYRKYNDDRNVLKQVVANAEKAGEDMDVLWTLYESAFGPKEYFSTYWGNTRFEENLPAYVTDQEWSEYLRKNPFAYGLATKPVLGPAQIRSINAQARAAGLPEMKAAPVMSSEGDKRVNQIILITASIVLLYVIFK